MSSHISPGKAFRVTRNKLSFLDHLPEVLAAGEPVERGTEKRFRDWLIRSHHEFDKCTRFSGLMPAKEQSRIRALLGDDSVVAFERAAGVLQSDPSATIAKGAILSCRPGGTRQTIVGRVVAFLVQRKADQAIPAGGLEASGGEVLLLRLPALLFGETAPVRLSLRRIEHVLDAPSSAAAETAELQRCPSRVSIVSPLSWAAGLRDEAPFPAGTPLPAIECVVLSGGNKPTKRAAAGNGQQRPISVTERLFFFGEHDTCAMEAAAPLFAFVNAAPGQHGRFAFWSIAVLSGGTTPVLCRAGRYCLRLSASAEGWSKPLIHDTVFSVSASDVADLAVPKLGPEALPSCSGSPPQPPPLRLGVAWDWPIRIFWTDAFGNPVPPPRAGHGALQPTLDVVRVTGTGCLFRADWRVARRVSETALTHFVVTPIVTPTPTGTSEETLSVFSSLAHNAVPQPLPVSVRLSAEGAAHAHAWPLSLLPGLPVRLEVLEHAAHEVHCGAPLPFRLRCLDAWGNVTIPVAGVGHGWRVLVSGDACRLEGGEAVPEVSLSFDPSGVAHSTDASRPLRATSDDTGSLKTLVLTLVWDALAGTSTPPPPPPAPVCLQFVITRSRFPTSLCLLVGGILSHPVETTDPNGGESRWSLHLSGPFFVAGAVIEDLSVSLLDGGGRPCAAEGMLHASWAEAPATRTGKGRAARREGAAAPRCDIPCSFTPTSACTLPPLKLQTRAGLGPLLSLRFTPNDAAAPALSVEISITAVAGPPAAWSLSVSRGGEAAGEPSCDQGLVEARCDAAFTVVASPVDAHGNVVTDHSCTLPCPELSVAAESGEDGGKECAASLAVLVPASFEPTRGWRWSVSLGGRAGLVRLVASSTGHSPLIQSDSFRIRMVAGLPARLIFSHPAVAGTAAALLLSGIDVTLPVILQAVDKYGNPALATDQSVLLQSSALPQDVTHSDSRLAVSITGKKERKLDPLTGSISFGDVRLTALAPGVYVLRAVAVLRSGKSAAHSISDAVLLLRVPERSAESPKAAVIPTKRVRCETVAGDDVVLAAVGAREVACSRAAPGLHGRSPVAAPRVREGAVAPHGLEKAVAASALRQARLGSGRVASALQHVLGSGSPDVVGAVASLFFCDNDALTRALSFFLGGRLLTAVLTTRESVLRLRGEMRAPGAAWHNEVLCAFTSLDSLQRCSQPDCTTKEILARFDACVPGESKANTARRHAFINFACDDAECPPLRLRLPHLRTAGSGPGEIAAVEGFPPPFGIVAHAVNLLRPSRPHDAGRRSLLYALVSDCVVFEDLRSATAYRAACVAHALPCPTLLGLDCERVTAGA